MERNIIKAQPEKIKAPVIETSFAEFLCPFCHTPVDEEPEICPTCGAPLDYMRFLPYECVNFTVTPENLPLLIEKYSG